MPTARLRSRLRHRRRLRRLSPPPQVLPDGGSIKARLDENKFFSKPRLGLDAVGGSSAARLAECLQEGCPLVVYGCMSGKSPQFQWSSYVFRDLQARRGARAKCPETEATDQSRGCALVVRLCSSRLQQITRFSASPLPAANRFADST